MFHAFPVHMENVYSNPDFVIINQPSLVSHQVIVKTLQREYCDPRLTTAKKLFLKMTRFNKKV